MATNDFLTFCPTDSGTNLDSLAFYATASDRITGNAPGVARKDLVNRALRQANAVTSTLAQLVSNTLGVDVNDDDNQAKLLAQLTAAVMPLDPIIDTFFAPGTSTLSPTVYFFVASANATAGATYTNNSQTFTVQSTIAAGILLQMSATGLPSVSGTLVKSSGTGDSTITFYAYRSPKRFIVTLVAGGGGGGPGGTSVGTPSGNGGNSSFGTLITCQGGSGGGNGGGGTGGTNTVNSPAIALISIDGTDGGGGGQAAVYAYTGSGGGSALGGAGLGGAAAAVGRNAKSSSGSGGGGGSSGSGVSANAGGGGASGSYVKAEIPNPSTTYTVIIGAGGSAGLTGGQGNNGGVGAGGLGSLVQEF